MDSENVEWVIDELNVTAERAEEEGVTPTEYMAALVAYTENFREEYADP